LRVLRAVCGDASPGELIGLTFPLGSEAMIECLEQPCAAWLPYARELGVGGQRLTLLGFPTAACREIRRRFV
jgi:hypothetical protein